MGKSEAWRGTPLPPVERPLSHSPRRDEIANRVWRWGGAETALRNSRHFIYAIIDHGTEEDWRFAARDIRPEVWRWALASAQPGEVCRGGHRLFSLLFGADPDLAANWPDNAHFRDIKRGHKRRLRQLIRRNQPCAPTTSHGLTSR